MGTQSIGSVFVSYRRTNREAVDDACCLLRACGIEPWVDRTEVEHLDDFPQRIREGIANSHAVLIWWSKDYAESDVCLQEFRLAWQYARQHSSEVGQRVWIVNPEKSSDHIFSGDISQQSYLPLPMGDVRQAWGDRLAFRLSALVSTGTLSATSGISKRPSAHGTPSSPALRGRAASLMQVHSALFPAVVSLAAAFPTVHLSGLAGIGKSAVASCYASEFALAFPGGIWWFNMAAWGDATPMPLGEALDAWLSALRYSLLADASGLLVQLTEEQGGRLVSPATARQRVARVLHSSNLPYLWVLDNLPNIHAEDVRNEALFGLRAPTSNGRTIVTSQDARPLPGARVLRLPALSQRDGEMLLTSYVPVAQREHQGDAITQIVLEVGAHSMALVLLGRQLAKQTTDGQRMLGQLRQLGAVSQLEQLHKSQTAGHRSPAASVLAAFQLSFAPLDRDARRLLALASACASNVPIPVDLLESAFRGDQAGKRFTDALEALHTASLVERLDASERQVMVHSMVASVAIKELRAAVARGQSALADALITRLKSLDNSAAGFVSLRSDVPHAVRLLLAVKGKLGVQLAAAVANFHLADGNVAHALRAAREALERADQCCALSDPIRSRAELSLSAALADDGELGAAAEIQQRLLTAACASSGPINDDALTIWSHLADTRLRQGLRAEAEDLQRRLLNAMRESDTPRPWETLSASSALAGILYAQRRYAEARAMQGELLVLTSELRGAGSADAMVVKGNLAVSELAMDRPLEAIRLQSEVVASSRHLYRQGHQTLRIHLTTLADALVGVGQCDAASQLYEEVLRSETQELGAQHPQRLSTLGRLIVSRVLVEQGPGIATLLKDFMTSAGPTLPAGHPQVLDAVEELAEGLRSMGYRIGPMSPLLKQVLCARVRDLSDRNRDTIHTLMLFASALSEDGHWQLVCDIRERALAASLHVLGDSDPGTASVMVGLAEALRHLGQGEEADLLEVDAEDCLVRACEQRLLH